MGRDVPSLFFIGISLFFSQFCLAMSKNVTIKDIAAEAGVSIALVSFVMNNRVEADGKMKYRVNDATRERVIEVAKRLNYMPNSAARILRKGKSKVLGLIVSDISNVFYGEIARNLETLAFEQGYTLLFASSDESPDKFKQIVYSFLEKGVEGFIVVPCTGTVKVLQQILNVGVPCVVLDRKNEQFPAPMIVLDNVAAMRSAVDILLKKGLKKIEMISYTMRATSITGREEGFISRMREQGISGDQIRIHRLPFDDIDSATDLVIPSIISRGVEGIVFATNALAIASIRKLSSMGVRIQKDIHLVGFDNSDVYDLFYPPIPHVGQPIDKICSLAFSYLKQLMDKKIEQAQKIVSLPGEVKA